MLGASVLKSAKTLTNQSASTQTWRRHHMRPSKLESHSGITSFVGTFLGPVSQRGQHHRLLVRCIPLPTPFPTPDMGVALGAATAFSSRKQFFHKSVASPASPRLVKLVTSARSGPDRRNNIVLRHNHPIRRRSLVLAGTRSNNMS